MTIAIPHIDTLPRFKTDVFDSHISYAECGTGVPVVFLHGNPTHSYLWRNIIPHVADLGRCLAPDLIGMGASGESPAGVCRFRDQARYLDRWFDNVTGSDRLVLVLHDWGSALGFHWARRNPHRVLGIAYMEALVQPRRWEDFPAGRDAIFRRLRSPEGRSMVLDDNFFVETVLPKSVLRKLSEEEMRAYRLPFADRARRTTTLAWAQEMPIEGEPADVVAEVEAYGRWLSRSNVPKLLLNAEPGALLTGRAREFCRTWPNQREVTVPGIHYVQEDAPHEIGGALRLFLESLPEFAT